MNPGSPVSVAHGSTAGFYVNPNYDHLLVSVVGCNGTLGTLGGYPYYVTASVTEDCTVTATFAIKVFGLSVTKSGAGTGTVTSSPAGIDCGSTCTTNFDSGTTVNLAQAPDPCSVFTGWSGATCSGTGDCVVFVNQTKFVTATYDQGMRVSAPNGSESWKRNSTNTISWRYLGSPGTSVKIELLKAGVVTSTLAASTEIGSGGYGYFSWRVPSRQATGTDYQVRVTSTTAPGYTDTSDAYFTIY